MLLYKYLSAERIMVLKDGLIRFTQASCLNDPFEVKPEIRTLRSPESLRGDIDDVVRGIDLDGLIAEIWKGFDSETRWRHSPARLKQMLLQGGDERSVVASALQGFEALVSQALAMAQPSVVAAMERTFREKFGALCLTEDAVNELMWSHYSGTYTGFLIEFDASHPFFESDTDPEAMRSLIKVEYRDERPYYAQLADESNSLLDTFFVKRRAWEYEQEWRMIRSFNEATKRIDTPKGEVCLFAFPPEAVSGIVLGYEASSDLRSEVEATVSSPRYAHVELYEARPDFERFGVAKQLLDIR